MTPNNLRQLSLYGLPRAPHRLLSPYVTASPFYPGNLQLNVAYLLSVILHACSLWTLQSVVNRSMSTKWWRSPNKMLTIKQQSRNGKLPCISKSSPILLIQITIQNERPCKSRHNKKNYSNQIRQKTSETTNWRFRERYIPNKKLCITTRMYLEAYALIYP